MENNYLKIIFVIDESGSMAGSERDVIGGFNNFVEKQKRDVYKRQGDDRHHAELPGK